jgi:MFS transporter, DHA2 family, multidrug resistance protein
MTEPVQVPGTAGHGDGVRRGHDSCHAVNMSAQPNDSAPGVTRVDIGYTVRLDAALLAIVLVCVLPGVMAQLDFTAVYVAQPTFMAVFHAPQVAVAWTATGYALAQAAAMGPSGWAINRFGARQLFAGSVVVFTLGSVLCAMAASVTLLIGARVVQGVGAGLLMPTTFTVLIRAAGPARLGRVLALTNILMLMGPILGPVLGGWLIATFSWRWIFLINVPVGVLAAVLAVLILADDSPSEDESLDLHGAALLCPGVGALLYGLAELPKYGTINAPQVFVPAVIGAAMLIVFVWHALRRAEKPMIDLGLLRQRVVATANTARFLFTMSYVGPLVIFPLYFQQVLGATPMRTGILLASQAVGAAVSSPVIGRITDRHGPRGMVLVGTVVSTAALGVFIWAIGQPLVPIAVLILALAVTGMGASAIMIPVASAAVHTLNNRDAAHASTLLHVNHQIAAAIGIAGCSALLAGLSTLGAVHAYAAVLAASAGIGMLSLIPAALLPAKAHPMMNKEEP